ncbi:MAG: MFS transporter [Candidatus Thermoplasmatota archaeon]|jgi:MFS family permease
MIAPEIRRPLLADAVLSRLMDSLTGGAFLAGLGLLAGADNFGLAMLAAIPFLAQVVQLPAVALLLRWQNRRRIVVWTAGLARGILLAIAVVLVLEPGWVRQDTLLLAMAAMAVLAVVSTAAWNWWMRDLIPPSELGAFFGQRLRGATIVSLLAMLAGGVLLDWLSNRGDEALGYAVLFAVGGVAGLLGVVTLQRTPHFPPPPSPPAKQSLLLVPRALGQTSKPLLFSLSFSTMAASFALPFAAIYLLRSLEYSFVAVTVMAVVSQIAYLFGLRGWAYVSDRHGDRGLLAITMSVLALVLVGWAIAGWSAGPLLTTWLTILHFLTGFAMGGIELAHTNLLLRTAGPGPVAAQLAGVSLVRATAGGLGVLAAGILWQSLGRGPLWTTTLPWLGVWELRGFQVLCLASLVLCIATAVSLRRMTQGQGGRTVDVARAMRREIHQMSSVAGIRGLIHAVSYYVELLAWPFAVRQRPWKPSTKKP